MTPAVTIQNLHVAYNSEEVLKDITLAFPKSQLSAIIGPNGAGKTTLLKAMLGLIPTSKGTISFAKDIPCIAYVPQTAAIDWDFPVTVSDVVMMGRYGRLGWFKRPKAADRQAVSDALSAVDMIPYACRQIGLLSGGQQQRVFLARAIAQCADIYLMDEPFKGVDQQTERAIITLLKALRDQGKTIISVHHDLQTVPDYFDHAALINLRVVANGPVSEVFHTQNILTLFAKEPAQ